MATIVDALPNHTAVMTEPEGILPASIPLPEVGSPPTPGFIPPVDSFALELRAESVEQLCGGDALRRGETERIEAGGSDGNTDLVAGCDRVQVQDKLTEHTGHGLAMQVAYLDTTVGGSSDTRVGTEDTVLLAGHMRDTWNGGTATVAAMSDDTAAGGGVRATAVLDLWAHGLMGLEERPGTCTSDAVLAEVCGTLYEREYRTAVHAAGLAVFNGTLYQSVRTSFRPLMRVSTGVRNLIAGGGGGAGGGAPPASPPPAAGEAGGGGAETAATTLATGRDAAEAPQAGFGAVHLDGAAETPPDGPGAAHFDDPAVLVREADRVVVADDLSELRHWVGAAEQLGAPRDALRAGAAPAAEAASGARIAEVGGLASADPVSWSRGALEIEPPKPVFGEKASAVQARSTRPRGRETSLGLLGGNGDSPQQGQDEFDWFAAYGELNAQIERYRMQGDLTQAATYLRVIADIDARVTHACVQHGRPASSLRRRNTDASRSTSAYRWLRDLAGEAERGGDARQAAAIRQSLTAIDRHTREVASGIRHRVGELPELDRAAVPPGLGDNRTDRQMHREGFAMQIDAAMVQAREATARGNRGAGVAEVDLSTHWLEMPSSVGASGEVAHAPVHPAPSLAGVRPGFPGPSGELVPAPDASRTVHRTVAATMYTQPPLVMGRLPTAGASRLPDVSSPADWVIPEVNRAFEEPSGQPVRILHAPEPPAASGPSGLAPTLPADIVPGGAAAQPASTGPVTAPHQGAESTFWLRPAEPIRAADTVQFDPGLHRVGEQPAVSQHEMDTYGELEGWEVDDFAVERALIAGRLPPGFDASELSRRWAWVTAGTPLAGQLEGGLLPFTTIDSMIEGYRSVDQGGAVALVIRQLQHMRESVARALADAYGYRADPGWLAEMDEFLRVRNANQAADAASGTGLREIDDIIEAAQASPRPAPLEPGLGTVRAPVGVEPPPPADGAVHARPPGTVSAPHQLRFGGMEVLEYHTAEPVSALTSRGRETWADVPQRWRSSERSASIRRRAASDSLRRWRRQRLVHRLLAPRGRGSERASDLMQRFGQAVEAGALGSPVLRSQAVASLAGDISRIGAAARRFGVAVAADERVDWRAIAVLFRLFDSAGDSP